ncbi:50S ribosomal protein L3 N(5)-glutamine methyltransferase [Gallionella capsiferriformans]|jgi:ribosomal protein L3 glutamine methyltransferase|uniref:Ribosomal protein uL3 glutamine methyltransferase n=1 Tax=Gallionella capsiferriformans (strain ES-2) TaxID=395494 RepID=D9SGU4_GALCS|nr:50S ribosomal protein L3 N(5)-glutamine methyltransferase [Gallionella capsiferriformans]ADL55741.1 protein-(glutamine-N5) methyltransferase, ribosomal protein L3-specific [Gallionella capsiferriformans ES-2]
MQISNYFSAASQSLLTVRDYLRFAVSRFYQAKLFFGHGSTDAYDEAVYLILHTLHLPVDTLAPFLDAQLTPAERGEVLNVIQRRVEQRIPAAYLTHEAFLGDYSFYVDERVIVPRSFIAELLRQQLAPWITEPDSIGQVLDLCTGSGCLAILCADAFPNATVDAVDLSPDALAVAERNVTDYELASRISLIESDLFAKLSGRRYDLIISNPPYVDAESVAALPAEYLHEPKLSLGSGHDGLDATRVILKHAAEHLTENGILIVEIGHNRDILEAAYPKLPFTWLDVTAGDQFVFMLHRNDLL